MTSEIRNSIPIKALRRNSSRVSANFDTFRAVQTGNSREFLERDIDESAIVLMSESKVVLYDFHRESLNYQTTLFVAQL